jgi:hypothetical protein
VTLLDVSVLLQAHDLASEFHHACSGWLADALGGAGSVGIPWHTALGFLRMSTNPKIYPGAFAMPEAQRHLDRLLDHPRVWMPLPGPQHRLIFRDLMAQTPGTHKWVADTHLAALAIEHGLTLVSTDGDFTRFRGLNFLNPLSVHRG